MEAGSQGPEGDGRGLGLCRAACCGSAAADLANVMCSSAVNTTTFNASAPLAPNTNASLVSPVLADQTFKCFCLWKGLGKSGEADISCVDPSLISWSPAVLNTHFNVKYVL